MSDDRKNDTVYLVYVNYGDGLVLNTVWATEESAKRQAAGKYGRETSIQPWVVQPQSCVDIKVRTWGQSWDEVSNG